MSVYIVKKKRLPRFLQAKRDLNQQTTLPTHNGKKRAGKRSVIKLKIYLILPYWRKIPIEKLNQWIYIKYVQFSLIVDSFVGFCSVHPSSSFFGARWEAFKFFHFTAESINFNVVLLPMTYCCIVWRLSGFVEVGKDDDDFLWIK